MTHDRVVISKEVNEHKPKNFKNLYNVFDHSIIIGVYIYNVLYFILMDITFLNVNNKLDRLQTQLCTIDKDQIINQ